MMLDSPGVQVRFEEAPCFEVRGPYAARTEQFARRWAEFYRLGVMPACAIEVVHAAPEHTGLGLGTQLALSVAAGLHAWNSEPLPPAEQLARSVQRGLRSAIGVYGFLEGGLIVERGRLADEPLSPLDCRVDLPDEWRVVICWPPDEAGLSGAAETEAFAKLPPVPTETTAQLVHLLREQILPAALRGDFAAFSESIYQYGYMAGMCYRAIQGGPFCSPRVAKLVHYLREAGVAGIGQSSWGPAVFALQPDAHAAKQLRDRLRGDAAWSDLEVCIARIANSGAHIAP